MSEKTETRPRRTLADVVANPPEGWKVKPYGHCVLFGWYARPDVFMSGTMVEVESGKVVEHSFKGPDDWRSLRDVIAAHRAVADLLDLLAEVSE